jgi:predicted porin
MAVQAAQASALGATNAERRMRELEQELRILKSRMKAVAVRRAGANTRTLSVRRVRKRVQVIVDAQVHRAVLFGLSRRDTEIIHTDGDQSSTRIRIRGRAHAPGGWRVEARIEFELESNPSNRTDDTNIDEVRPPSLRKARIRFRHRRWGTIALGRESTATSGITSLDLSATRVAIYSNVETAGGGFRHTNSMLDPPVGGTTVGSVWDNFDGASRAELLRYDSPKWYGFWLSAS